MKRTLYRLFGCALLLAATVMPGKAANGIIDTLYYSICSGDTITVDLHQTPVYESTVLYDTIPGASVTEDSIHMYVVTLYPKFRHVEHRDLVPGQHFEWHGMVIQSAGTYTKVYKSVTDCDSTYVMVVSEKQGVQLEFRSMKTIPFCDSIEWNGIMYRESQILVDTLRSLRYGCDSIVTTALEKGISFRKYDTDSLVLGETLLWHGLSITEGGDYIDKHTSKYGCDSTYVLHVEMIPALEIHPRVVTTHEDICEGDAFEWRGINRSQTGTYYDTAFVNGTEIDSLFVLHLQVHSPSTKTEMLSFSTFPQQYRGETITGPGIYSVTYLSSFGCDSTIRIIVNRQAIVHEESATICAGEEYIWRQKHLREEQTYYETVKAKDGTDSVSYVMHLHVRSIPETHITRTICNGDSYMFGNQLLTEAGVYRHAYKTEGCDSVVVLSLNIADVDTIVQVRRLEAGSTYTWPANGYTYSKAGIYEVRETNRFGCDSIIRLVLTVNHVDTIDTVATICPGDHLVWHTIDAGQTGHYENVETDPHGDMRYYRLDLTVRDLTEQEVRFTICGDESLTFNGKQYSQAGHYYDKGSCDTLYHIIVTQDPLKVYTTNANLDGVNPYVWHFMRDGVAKDSAFAVAGTYEFRSPNPNTGCNDIWRLILRQDANDYHFVEQVTLCEGEQFSWRGLDNLSLVPGDAVYKQEYKTISGRDSIYELQVKVLPISRTNETITFCGSMVWKGTEYTQSATVYDTLTAANSCDSIITVSLRHIDPFFRRDTATIVQGEQLKWHGQTITTDGVYQDKKVNQFGCDSIYELHVGIQAATPQTNMITEMVEICEGDYYEWRGHKYYNKGSYPDTVFAQTVEERDTIYVLNLDVRAVVRRHEQYTFCEDETLQSIYGVNYNNKVKTGEVYRDTVTVLNPNNVGCPDTVYIEIYKYPVTRHIEVQTLLAGETIQWHEQTITRPGTYKDEKEDGGIGGCKTIDYLRVVADSRKTVVICVNDTAADIHPDKRYPYFWEQTQEYYYTTGLWTDTVFDAEGLMKEFYSLDLTITQPYDTTVYVHGCDNKGAWWRDQLYWKDTTFVERVETLPYNPEQPCDSIFHVHIKIDKTYTTYIDTTLCEYQLPLIIGRVNPDTIWWEGDFRHESDSTVCGCDSIIEGHLTIIPKLSRNDSTFVCEDFFINGGSVTLGDTVHPAFIENDGGKWADKWQGKWTGIQYTEDTIVWDCDHRYFHHIIVRPHQSHIPEYEYSLCKGDSVQLFWPHKDTWIKEPGDYMDTIPSISSWADLTHNTLIHNDRAFACDSIVKWKVRYTDTLHVHLYEHIRQGETYRFNDSILSTTGAYDSIGYYIDVIDPLDPTAPAVTSMDSAHHYCKAVYTLHLTVDPVYRYKDTIEFCYPANREYTYTFDDDKEEHFTFKFQTPDRDTAIGRFSDSTKNLSYGFYDHYYDLVVYYKQQYHTLIKDTLCYGDSLQFDQHFFEGENNRTVERYLKEAGIYLDTLTAHNGCDSIIELRLELRDRIVIAPQSKTVSDRELPYLWVNDTHTDSLVASGQYTYTMPNRYGCDSTVVLNFTVHQTHVFRDTIDVCSALNKSMKHTWSTGYIQDFNTPLMDDSVFYADTLETRIKYDSIYVLCVNFHQTYETLIRDTICEGERYRFDRHQGTQTTERWLETAGTYYDTVESRYGCDSVTVLKLFVRNRVPVTHPIVHIPDTAAPYLWYHKWSTGDSTQVLSASGEYAFVMPNIYGCDSIDSLSLFIHKTYRIQEDSLVICHDQTPYTWQDRNDITNTCDLVFHALTQDGYDSIRYVHIEVLPEMYTLLTQTICEGDSLRFGLSKMNKERFLTDAGVYYDTLTSEQFGCDSIIELRLNIYPKHYNYQIVDVADTQLPYLWEHIQGGQTVASELLNGAGEYSYHFTTEFGCDSIDSLSLRVHRTYYIVEDTIDICTDRIPFTWCSYTNITETDDYIYYGQTADGYDSIRTVHINVWPVKYETIYRSICEGSQYTFGGKDYTTQGTYYDTLITTHGCDSIVTLHLNVLPKYYHTIDRTIYEGDTVQFMGQTYSTSGVYPVRFTSSIGCDSIIELRLTVARLYDDSVSVCANDLPLAWRGQTIYESGIYRDTVIGTNGTSMIGIKVTVLPIAHLAEPIMQTICEGDFYKFGDSILTTQGTYYDTLTAANGCDSIVTLVLQVQPTEYKSEVRRIFEGDSVLFNGVWYKESGVYERRETNSNGCTDTYQLILTVLKSFNIDTTAVVCDNELPFIWRGYEYNESGDYSLPIAWTDSSRVVKTLHLTVNHTFYMEQNISICSGDTFRFNGKQYFESGVFYDTVPSKVGCDSVTKYIISVHPSVDKIIEKHISDKQPYNFHGRDLTLTGTYEWTGKTVHGCDSIEHLYLTVHPSFFQSDTLDLCQSDSINYPYVWKDPYGRTIATISQSGVYSDSVLTEYGFDSVHQLVVHVHPSFFIREQYEIGVGEHLKIHGRDISQPAIYYDTLRTIHGCDSIFHVVVNQKRTREWTWDREICQGEYYEFFGRKLTHTGQYKYTSEYKDSIITLNLTVNPISITETRKVITDKQIPYIYNGRIYEQGGIYNDTLVNKFGCDSILRFVLIVSKRYSDWTPMALCPGSEIKIDGEVITEAGLYTFLRRSRVTGEMDSIWRVEIYDAPAFEFADTLSLCDGDTIYFGNKAITHGGNQDIKFKTVDGCDSIYHLHVKVYPSYSFDTTVTIFDYQTYTWEQNHQNYTVEGTYTKTFPTRKDPFHTCDSTYILNLKVIPTTRHDMEEYTICDGQEYTWRGKTYTKEGFYYDTIANPATYVSAIYSLHLLVSHPTYITSATATPICADDKTYSIAFEYDGAKPTLYSIYYDQRAKDEGFKDVINKPFLGEDQFAIDSVPTKTDVIYLEHTSFIKPNKYYMSLVLDNGVCGQSRADNIELLVKYPNWIIEQNWNDIVVPLKKELNGGYEFSQADWIVNGVRQLNNGRGYLEYNFRDGDEVVMIATRKGENYAIETCPLVISINPNMAYDDPILIYPTQAPKQMPRIHIESPKDGMYEVYGSTGTLLFSGNFSEGETMVTLPAINGIYFIRTMAQGAEPETHKVIIY